MPTLRHNCLDRSLLWELLLALGLAAIVVVALLLPGIDTHSGLPANSGFVYRVRHASAGSLGILDTTLTWKSGVLASSQARPPA